LGDAVVAPVGSVERQHSCVETTLDQRYPKFFSVKSDDRAGMDLSYISWIDTAGELGIS
jgi:hypothetical protein